MKKINKQIDERNTKDEGNGKVVVSRSDADECLPIVSRLLLLLLLLLCVHVSVCVKDAKLQLTFVLFRPSQK